MASPIFTIGHSTHPLEQFLELLQHHGISAVCDVRSAPYSRMNPQFNREPLKDALRERSITYVYLGKELGARSDDASCYRNGKVRYELLANTALFLSGIERVKKGAEEYRIALMCAEKDPLHCHRTILVSRHLVDQGYQVQHVLADGGLESHEEALERLIESLKMSSDDLFRTKEEAILDAYRAQADAIAYQRTPSDDSESTAPARSAQG